MSKFFGNIGFAIEEETSPGVWSKVVTPKPYSGEVLDNRWRTQTGSNVNQTVTFNGDFSVLADPYALKNHPYIVYVEYMGVKWEVTGVSVSYPRLLLTVGGVYNEETKTRTAGSS